MDESDRTFSTVIIFDYDDTLICSTYLQEQNFSRDLVLSLERHHLEDSAIGALSCASACGEVIIITNANFQWVQYSLTHFFPNLFSFLIENKIPIISSHALFSSHDPTHPSLWKHHTFHMMMQSFLSSGRSIHHLTSIGDSIYEKVASQSISAKYRIPCNLIQFLPTPSVTQLTKQLQILQHYLRSNLSIKPPDFSQSLYLAPYRLAEEEAILPFSDELSPDHWSPVINCEYEMQIQSPISDGIGDDCEEDDLEVIELLLTKRSPSFDFTTTVFS